MNDDEMDRRLSEFADQWTGEFTEPALPRPTVQPRVRRAWIGPTAVASLVAAAVVAVLMVSNIRDDRANPAVSPPTTGPSAAVRTSSASMVDDSASDAPGTAAPISDGGATGTSATEPADLPLIGTTWYLVGRINNTLEMQNPAGRNAWLRFTDTTVSASAIEDNVETSEGGSCQEFELPAVVADGVVEFGAGAQRTLDAAGSLCDLWNLGFRQGKLHVEVHGREMRSTVNWGTESSTNIYSAGRPAEPTIPDRVDLGFLPPPADQTAKERLDTGLRGRTFAATEITGREILEPGITMRFGTGFVRVDSGCNHGGGSFVLDGNAVTFGVGGGTLMDCDAPRNAQEQWLFEFLNGSHHLDVDGDTMHISGDGVTMTLTETNAVEATPTTEGIDSDGKHLTIDEIVLPDGAHPLPDLESGQFWDRTPTIDIYPKALLFHVGCGQLRSPTTGTLPEVTAGAYDSRWWIADCPPNRTALADALRYILSGRLTIEQDGPFVTITGRDGLAVTAHSSF